MGKSTWHIHIRGQVQGVGFRPFVYRIAREYNLSGWVNNTVDGVHVEFNAGEETAREFNGALIDKAPELSVITGHGLKKVASRSFEEFKIVHSESEGKRDLLLTPDFAMCRNCREELFDRENRRYGYPFITCTNCGPRYSIVESLPYDRERTTMEKFPMCERCKKEYEDPLDRRYYSQTNSCCNCGITLILYNTDRDLITSDPDRIIQKVNRFWEEGRIVAIKGIGGYLLTCDASNGKAIETLRDRKQRPAKPFALMYPDLQLLEQDVRLGEKEKKALTNAASPILLLQLKEDLHSDLALGKIAPGLTRLGVMLPYTPLYALMLEAFDRPIIATSGNFTNSPIVYTDQKAMDELIHIADFMLTNDRDIVVPQDDSVMGFTKHYGQKIIYRRSWGFAPTYINKSLDVPNTVILSTGALLKSTFTYLHRQNIYISQYLGDLDHYDTERNFKHTVDHFTGLLGEQPELLLADKHPDYFSTRFAEQFSEQLNVPVLKYQHHVAHFAAVLGEHNLVNSDEPVLGVIWDGTGLGDDGNIWGGEFFLYADYSFSRCSHFDYFDFIGGDKMPREPRISALSIAHTIQDAEAVLREKFTDLEWSNYHTLLQKPDNLKTSSVGRLFDAASSLLGLKDRSNYEGEAAMLLETHARKYVEQAGLKALEGYCANAGTEEISTVPIIRGIINDIEKGVNKKKIAARFHCTLVEIIAATAEQSNVTNIAFSGGVFQNTLLIDLIIEKLSDRFSLFFHENLSPNDENISFGQLVCYLIESTDHS